MFMKEISSDGDVSTVSEWSMHGLLDIIFMPGQCASVSSSDPCTYL